MSGAKISRKHRIQFDISENELVLLRIVKHQTGVRSRVDVIRNALTLYLWLSDLYFEGYTLRLLKKRDDEEEIQIDLPGIGLG